MENARKLFTSVITLLIFIAFAYEAFFGTNDRTLIIFGFFLLGNLIIMVSDCLEEKIKP